MRHWITNAALVAGIALTFIAAGPVPARAGRPLPARLHGVIEQLPDTPDSVGRWTIDGHDVVVDSQTRLEERTDVRADGHWTHATTGFVLRAPAWGADDAHAAGFRPAIAAEVGGLTLGRPVKATVVPDESGVWRAVTIELHDRAVRLGAR